VFRLVRSSHLVAPDRVRFVLRAEPIVRDANGRVLERARELDTDFVLDKIAHRQAVPTPQETFEALWQQLRLDLDAREGLIS
jgi:hypothetical protein